jgi:hypothetical protein
MKEKAEIDAIRIQYFKDEEERKKKHHHKCYLSQRK